MRRQKKVGEIFGYKITMATFTKKFLYQPGEVCSDKWDDYVSALIKKMEENKLTAREAKRLVDFLNQKIHQENIK